MWESLIHRLSRTSHRTRVIAAVVATGTTLFTWATLSGHLVSVLTLLVLAGGGTVLVRRMRRVKAVKDAKIKAAVGRTKWPRRLGPWLLTDETIDWEGRKHPVAVLRWWALLAGSLIASIAGGLLTGRLIVALVLLFGPGLYAGYHILGWWTDWRAITNGRIIEVTGLFTTKAPAMPLARLVNAYSEEPLLSRLLGLVGLPRYYEIRLETSAQVESIPELKFVRDPQQVNELLQAKFMPPKS